MSDVLKRIISGDKKAARELYLNYSPKILAYLVKRLPSYEDAQEITQDVFFEVIDSLPFFQRKTNIINWLYKIAHNKTVDYYRKRKIKTILLSKMPFLQLLSAEINEPEFQFEKNKIRDKIEKVFDLISPKHQKVLHLHYEKGLRVKEIAIILNLSLKATESLLFRARKNFILTYERT